MSQKSITIRIQRIIISHMQSHCMTVQDMMYHVRKQYPRVPDYIITNTIKMMIDEYIIRISFAVNSIDLYSNSKNQNILQMIWTYIVQMNYTATHDELITAFEMTDENDIADAIGVMVAKNIITKKDNDISLSVNERCNVLRDYPLMQSQTA